MQDEAAVPAEPEVARRLRSFMKTKGEQEDGSPDAMASARGGQLRRSPSETGEHSPPASAAAERDGDGRAEELRVRLCGLPGPHAASLASCAGLEPQVEPLGAVHGYS